MNISILLYVRKDNNSQMEVFDTKVVRSSGEAYDAKLPIHNIVVNLTDGYNNFTAGKAITVDSNDLGAIYKGIREAVKSHDNPGMLPFAERWFLKDAEDAFQGFLMADAKRHYSA